MAYKTINSYAPLSDNDSQRYYASFLPKGQLFANKLNSNSIIYKLIYCLADFIKQLTAQIYILFYSNDTNRLQELLSEAEIDVGIPAIFPRQATVTARRLAIQSLRNKIPVINVQPYAMGTLAYNNGTGIVTGTITTSAILTTNQISAIIMGALQSALNGLYLITYVSSSAFTYTIASGLGLIGDTFRATFNFTSDIRTTYENFVYNLTGIIIHIYFANENSTNRFPMTFPIIFSVPYYQALLLFNIHVVGVSLPESEITLLNTVLGHVIPSVCCWQFTLVES